jgi:hypothetical protein
MAKPSLADEVLSQVANSKPGFLSWFGRLPPDAQAELEAVRAAFNPAVHQKQAYALAVIESCRKRGWETAGVQGVKAWLNKRSS